MTDLHFFDRSEAFTIFERKLPHWAQPGVLCFITFRLADSMPRAVVQQWHTDRARWLRANGIEPWAPDWKQELGKLDRSLQDDFYRTFSTRWHRELDACYGDCPLRDSKLARIVGSSLQYGNNERYELTDFVVMPNHVHLIAAFPTEEMMLQQCESWKRWTATRINRLLNRSGRLWQQDGFDHLVRSEEQLQHFKRYIATNPLKARLREGEYLQWSQQEN